MNNKPNQIIKVDPKPIEPVKIEPSKTGGLRIGRVNTLNLIVEPLKKRYHKHYKNDKMHLIVDIALGAIILILTGVLLNIWIFSRSQANLMSFKVTSPDKLINGSQTEFTIDYANTTNDELKNVNLVLKIPDTLRQPKYSLPDFNTTTNTLTLGNLAAKAHGQFKVSGFLIGNFNDQQEFISVINYQNKYGQNRQESFKQDFQLTDSVLALQFQVPNKIIANGHFDAKINVKNTAAFDFTNLNIKILWPANFNLLDTSLNHDGQLGFDLGSLKGGQSNDYLITGKISADKPQTLNFSADLFADYAGQSYLLTKSSASSELSFSKLQLNFLQTDNNLSIAPGGSTTYTLHYKNNENYALKNVTLGVKLSGEYADLAFLKQTYPSNANGNQIIFNQNQYPFLATIAPGQEGQIQVKAAAKKLIDFSQASDSGYQITANVVASFDDSAYQSRVTLESAALSTQLDSLLSLNTTALFYTAQGDQIGVGSVPPQVGEYTSYWVIIKANNTNNKIKNLKITAKVPAGIDFTNIYNVTDGDQITYDANTGLLVWQVADINASAGYLNPAPEARIQLAITPIADQIGKSPLLLTNIQATATDALTNAFLTASGADVSTAIFSDSSKNKVIQ